MSSTHHVELSPSDAGFQDRYVVQEVIKEMAKNRPIDIKGKKGFKGNSDLLPVSLWDWIMLVILVVMDVFLLLFLMCFVFLGRKKKSSYPKSLLVSCYNENRIKLYPFDISLSKYNKFECIVIRSITFTNDMLWLYISSSAE